MASYISPGPLCNQCTYCTILQRPDYHSRPLEAISTLPSTGIVFKAYEYSATQLSDAFEKLIPGYMDYEIKRQALARWNTLIPELLDGPLWHESEFDLKDSFFILDDFLFLRALRHRCRVEWVDRCRTGWKRDRDGWCEGAEETNQGPTQWIRLVRPTVESPRTVWNVLCVLMHEMCHAIFAFRCDCFPCRCLLNKINGEGLDGHGPSWEKLRRAVERTANRYLKGLSEPIVLCHQSEPQAEIEDMKTARALNGLYEKVTQQGSKSAELKRRDWAKRAVEAMEKVTEEEKLETVAYAGAMFRKCERRSVFGAR